MWDNKQHLDFYLMVSIQLSPYIEGVHKNFIVFFFCLLFLMFNLYASYLSPSLLLCMIYTDVSRMDVALYGAE
jgi:hypothetical protein